jgi:transposase
MALGLLPPWFVTRSVFDAEAKRLDIHLDFPRGSRFACPACAQAGCPAHDTDEMTWRHLNFFQHEAFLHARAPRVTCSACGAVRRVSVPWARDGSGFTLLFEALAMTMMSAMPVAAVGRLMGEHDTRLWRVLHHYVEEARARADYAGVTKVAFDETAARRGHDYVSLFVDLAGPRVMFVTEGKDAATVKAFADDLARHGGAAENVSEVCIDMSPAFIKGTEEHLPKADITFDKFHAVKIVNSLPSGLTRGKRSIWSAAPSRRTGRN